jgi:DNA-binding response OmpR family regulator
MDLKKRFPRLPILAISGQGKVGPKDYLQLASALGADDVLAKPFSPKDLVAKIRKFLPRKR